MISILKRPEEMKLVAIALVAGAFWLAVKTSHWIGISMTHSLVLVALVPAAAICVWLGIRQKKIISPDANSLQLGRYIDDLGNEIFALNPEKFRHVLVTGVTGAGKSTLIRKYIEQILTLDRRFLYVDFKGERVDFEEILEICRNFGIEKELQIFDLSDPDRCVPFNLLTVFPDVEETVGFITGLFFDERANPYYRNEAERFLRFTLQLLDSAGVPRSFIRINEVFYHERTRKSLLSVARSSGKTTEPFFLYFESEFSELSARDRSERFSGFTSVLSSFTSEPLKKIFNSNEKTDLNLSEMFSKNLPVIIRVPGEAYGDLSARIVQAFIKALPVLIARRRNEQLKKDYFILLDEGCSYMNDTVVELLKKAGSAGVKMLVTRMSDADFESVGTGFKGKMISAFSVFICFQTMDPDTRETLARLSMTIDDVKFTRKTSVGQDTGEGSARDVQRFKIHPTEFGKLKTGDCFVIAPSLTIFRKAHITRVGEKI